METRIEPLNIYVSQDNERIVTLATLLNPDCGMICTEEFSNKIYDDMASNPMAILVMDEDLLTSEIIKQIAESTFSSRTVILTNCPQETTLKLVVEMPYVNHFVAFDQPSLRLILNPIVESIRYEKKCKIEFFMPLESIKTVNINKYSQRSAFEELAGQTISKLKVFSSLQNMISTILSELSMNAFFDAPVDRQTNSKLFNLMDRCHDVELPDKDYIEFSAGIHNDWLIFSVTDPYGSLAKEDLLRNLARATTKKGHEQINMGPGGAGMGTYMIFNMVNHIVFAVDDQQRTTVICFLLLSRSNREFEARRQSAHFFFQKNTKVKQS